MKRCMFVAAACLFAAPALADSGLMPVNRIGHMVYDMATGELRKADGSVLRGGAACWDASCTTGYFTGAAVTEVMLNWGDLDADCTTITSFQFGYATNDTNPQTVDVVFNSSDNGFCDAGRTPEVAFRVTGLPASDGSVYAGWLITIIPVTPIDLSGAADLDADGRGDFSYSFHFRSPHDNVTVLAGPLLAGDPNCGAPGNENAFDLYTADPNNPAGPNDLLLPDINTLCAGTFWFGGVPYASFYMVLDANGGGSGGCNTSCPGDIEPAGGGDGDVDLTDLSVMLGNFGTLSGATCDDGDIEPTGGDGDVDLTDLSIMLGGFGQPCP